MSNNSLTPGERRGIIWLSIIIIGIIGIALLRGFINNNSNQSETINIQSLYNSLDSNDTTINKSLTKKTNNQEKEKNKKKKRDANNKQRKYPTRNPLDEKIPTD